jgi:predicted DNA-binding transcriptional regulator AlpA
MDTGGHSSKLADRGQPTARIAGEAEVPTQLPLLFLASSPPAAPSSPVQVNGDEHCPVGEDASARPRLPMLDRLSTREVLRVIGVNRSTLFRWTKKGRFPRKHKSGKWLRSDVERWLSEHEGDDR